MGEVKVLFGIVARLGFGKGPEDLGERAQTNHQVMRSMNVTIRGLKESVFRKFKARAVEQGMKLGEALTMAMENWLKQPPPKRALTVLDLEVFDWGPGTEKSSLEIDKILYGENL